MSRLYVGGPVYLLAIVLGLTPAWADQGTLFARLNPWGRFQPGAWKVVRVVTETLDEQGQPASTSTIETRTTLQKVDDDGVTLEVEMGIQVAGKQFEGPLKCVRQGFHGEPAGAECKTKDPVASELVIENRAVPCRTQELEFSAKDEKTLVQMSYSDATAPYVLKRVSTTTDADGKEVTGENSMEVVALDVPRRILSQIRNTAQVSTVQKTPKGTIVTLAVTSPDVPGGVVSHESKETDAKGRLIRRSTLEITSFGLQPEDERVGLFGRKRTADSQAAAVLAGVVNPAVTISALIGS